MNNSLDLDMAQSKPSKKRILIMAGGTGGHIFPALSVADEIKKQGLDVYWLGSQRGLEQQIVAQRYPMFCISMQGVRRAGWLQQLTMPFRLLTATYQAWRVMKKIRPDVVLGMGGFVAGPGGLAAWLAKIPVVVHEQNAVAGYANRLLTTVTKKVLAGFPNAFPAKISTQVVGNPVRNEIATLEPPTLRLQKRSSGELHILVLGGSQGAHALNTLVPEAIQLLPAQSRISLWHQTGSNDYDPVESQYKQLSLAHYKVEKFIHNMAEAYGWADVVVCRAGALTISELAAAGVASILVPFPYAVDDHQYVNGRYLEAAQAAWVIRQKDLTAVRLSQLLTPLIDNRQQLANMAENARKIAYPNATRDVVKICLEA